MLVLLVIALVAVAVSGDVFPTLAPHGPVLIWGARLFNDTLDIWVHSHAILTDYRRVRLANNITAIAVPDVLYVRGGDGGHVVQCLKQPIMVTFTAVKFTCTFPSAPVLPTSIRLMQLGDITFDFDVDRLVIGAPQPAVVAPPSTTNLSLCVGGIDDAGLEYVDDFVSYHLGVGVDHIVLGVSNLTKARERLRHEATVTLFDMSLPTKYFSFFHRGSWKLHFYDWCLSHLKTSTSTVYVGLWDLDEYFMPVNGRIDLSPIKPGCGVTYPLRQVYAPPYYLNETSSPRKRFPNNDGGPASFRGKKGITQLKQVEGAYFHQFIFANRTTCDTPSQSGEVIHHYVNLFRERVKVKPSLHD